MKTNPANSLLEIASRIKEMRDIMGFSVTEMAEKTEVSVDTYRSYESGREDLPFSFIHKSAIALGVDLTDLIEGHSARLTSYTVTRKGEGHQTASEYGISIQNLAPKFKGKIAEPYWVKYDYSEELQNKPISLTTHSGQEFDIVLSGSLLVQVGNNKELLEEGDSIYYDSSTPHGMIAVGGRECIFCAIVLPGEKKEAETYIDSTSAARTDENLIGEKYVDVVEDENGAPAHVTFRNTDDFNFGFDVVDKLAEKSPDKLAMIHLDRNRFERRFTFKDMQRESARTANYFLSLGIRRGDRVMLVLKRNYQFWFSIIALHKIGAIAVPATFLLKEHDYIYRFRSASVSAIVCTNDDAIPETVDAAALQCPTVKTKILVGGERDGWHDFNTEYARFSSHFFRTSDTVCGEQPMIIFFSSGTTGQPKMVQHKCTYALGHYLTAKYWH
ncbi:MAG: AMP-binding protein, partial [Clostridia bacterium]|nr:AMP-binding protein [Clostridia bacterium]